MRTSSILFLGSTYRTDIIVHDYCTKTREEKNAGIINKRPVPVRSIFPGTILIPPLQCVCMEDFPFFRKQSHHTYESVTLISQYILVLCLISIYQGVVVD